MDAESPIQVQAVNIPPNPPPVSPEYDYSEPEALPDPLPPPEQSKPSETLTEAPAPIATPAPRPQPTPTPTPLPAPSIPRPDDQSSLAPESLDPLPTPEQPTPEPDVAVPDQLAELPPIEQAAKDSVASLLEESGVNIADIELPPGIENWADYERLLKYGDSGAGFEADARRLGQLPSHTQGTENSGVASGDDSISTPSDSLEQGRRAVNPFALDNLNRESPRPLDQLAESGRSHLESGISNLNRWGSTPLVLPTPTPIPLPDYRTGDLGVMQYLTFNYDNLVFRAEWSGEEQRDKRLNVRYYPPAQPSQIQTLELPWQVTWEQNTVALVQDVLQAYEARKIGQL